MKSFYSFLILSIALYLVLLYNYSQAEMISTSVNCNPHKNLCVACPHLSINAKTNAFNKYTQISSKKQFYLLGTLNHFIMKNSCRDMLQIFQKREAGEWKLPDSVKQDMQNKNTFIRGSFQVQLAHGVQHHLTIASTADFVVIYEGIQPIYPLISSEREQNSERLMKFSRSLSWGMLFAFLLTYLDCKFGIFWDKRSYPLPLTELTIISCVIYLSYDKSSFVALFFPQIMCLVYVLSKVHRFDKHQKAVLMIGIFSFLVLCFVDEQMTIFADIFCLIAIKANFPKLGQSSARIKTCCALILGCLITNTLRAIGSLNFLTYSAYTAKIIFIPMTLMTLQSSLDSYQAHLRLNKTACKYYGQH